MKETVIFYHGNCLDGFSAAWVAHKKFRESASYVPVQHGSPLPSLKGKNVYFLDFCPSTNDTKRALKEAANLCVIDHHESVSAVIAQVPTKVYDLKRSGAVLTWKYFFPAKAVPKLILYVEDKDLWKFRMSRTEEVIAFLNLYDGNFFTWSRLIRDFDKSGRRKKLLEKGRLVLDYQKRIIGSIVHQAELVQFEGHEVLAANCPILNSEIGSALVKRRPPFSIIWYRHKGRIKVSLRSDGKINVYAIADKYGGGGHRGAAGFRLKGNDKLPWKVLEKGPNGGSDDLRE